MKDLEREEIEQNEKDDRKIDIESEGKDFKKAQDLKLEANELFKEKLY